MNQVPKILLCEDEEFVAHLYKRRLELEGFTVLHAHNGQEALDMLRADMPDLVILDLMMPLKNGFEVLEEYRKNPPAPNTNIPIIVASNLGQSTEITKAKELGAVDFIIKSNISLKDLVAIVRTHLPKM